MGYVYPHIVEFPVSRTSIKALVDPVLAVVLALAINSESRKASGLLPLVRDTGRKMRSLRCLAEVSRLPEDRPADDRH